jgi:hypothetical protein
MDVYQVKYMYTKMNELERFVLVGVEGILIFCEFRRRGCSLQPAACANGRSELRYVYEINY